MTSNISGCTFSSLGLDISFVLPSTSGILCRRFEHSPHIDNPLYVHSTFISFFRTTFDNFFLTISHQWNMSLHYSLIQIYEILVDLIMLWLTWTLFFFSFNTYFYFFFSCFTLIQGAQWNKAEISPEYGKISPVLCYPFHIVFLFTNIPIKSTFFVCCYFFIVW